VSTWNEPCTRSSSQSAPAAVGQSRSCRQYRALFGMDPEFAAADRIRDESGCVLRYERTFMRPLLPGQSQNRETT